MKKTIIILLIGMLCQLSSSLAQNHNLKFMALPFSVGVATAYYANISYEYQLSKNHSVGISGRSSLLSVTDEKYRHSQSADIYYHYCFFGTKKVSAFIGFELAYAHLRNGNTDDAYYSDNYSAGPDLGFRTYIGSSNRWFFETSVGANISKRNYYIQIIEYNQDEGEPPLPEDKFLFLARVTVTMGLKL